MHLPFLILKTCWNNSFVERVVHIFTNGFLGRKVFRTFEKWAPGYLKGDIYSRDGLHLVGVNFGFPEKAMYMFITVTEAFIFKKDNSVTMCIQMLEQKITQCVLTWNAAKSWEVFRSARHSQTNDPTTQPTNQRMRLPKKSTLHVLCGYFMLSSKRGLKTAYVRGVLSQTYATLTILYTTLYELKYQEMIQVKRLQTRVFNPLSLTVI